MCSFLVSATRTIALTSSLLLLLQPSRAQSRIVHVRYGYFSETRPFLAACARGWLDLYDSDTDTDYKVGCYPQSSGNFVASRLDNLQLDVAHIGSTPWAQAVARGVDAKEIYTSHYMGESQGIYVRPTHDNYSGIVTPYDLRDRRVGVPFGSTTHYQLLFLIELLGLKGSVTIVNMSPREIVEAWDDNQQNPPVIDAAAIWGTARDYILEGGIHNLPAKTLLSSGVISGWGRSTYVVVAASRTFSKDHPNFIRHFVGVISRIADSFIDVLGENDEQNVLRWEPSLNSTSFIPSMVDALMLEDQVFGKPTEAVLFQRRASLDLFDDKSAADQLSCQFMGSGPRTCAQPTVQHSSLLETAEFLVEQKVLERLGPMESVGDDDSCQTESTFCGGDIIDGTYLHDARADCVSCLPVGPYARTEGKVSSSDVGPDILLRELERLDRLSGKSPFATTEVGRKQGDSTFCQGDVIVLSSGTPIVGQFGDGANGDVGLSYSDELECVWEIRGVDCATAVGACERFVQVSFSTVRLWSGDRLKVYADPEGHDCASPMAQLVGELTGFQVEEQEINDYFYEPTFRSKGCLRIVLETDSNEERFYGAELFGDGFRASFDRIHAGCSTRADCNGKVCHDGQCQCGGLHWGADCGPADQCFGTNHVVLELGQPQTITSSNRLRDFPVLEEFDVEHLQDYSQSLDPSESYPNDAFCSFEIQVPKGYSFVLVEILYDLEPTYDLVTLFRGVGSQAEPMIVLTGTHRKSREGDTYYVPVDKDGFATLRFTSDARGRRRGFTATVRAFQSSSEDLLFGHRGCPVPGSSGFECEVPHCVQYNRMNANAQPTSSQVRPWVQGRIKSQTFEYVPAMPWAPEGGCTWPLDIAGTYPSGKAVGVRLAFNTPLDIEAFPATAVGDKLVLRQQQDLAESSQEFYIEACQDFEACSETWQTGECVSGGCLVRTTIEVPFTSFEGANGPFEASVLLVTDRNDVDGLHRGVDMDVFLVQQCRGESGTFCSDVGGDCRDGFCYCDGLACDCSCDNNTEVISQGVKIGIVVGIVVPVFALLLFGFYMYRRKKINRSREHKKVILEKDAELEQFRNSVVGMRAVIADYVPAAPKDAKEMARTRTKVQWCWRETEQFMTNHNDDDVYGDKDGCWIKYKNSDEIEKFYLKRHKKGTYSPLRGYRLDFEKFLQTKEATGFQREVRRFVEKADDVDVKMDDIVIGGGLPEDLAGEPQIILVKGDIIQISKQREDEWAFGSKLHHENEARARKLLDIAVAGEGKSSDDSAILTDTGWFPLENTRQPTGDDLASLQSQVGDTGELAPPSYWDAITDPTVVQCTELQRNDPERVAVEKAFLLTLLPPHFEKVTVLRVQRIQNIAMWQSYVVKRQTICYRENPDASTSQVAKQTAIDRYERKLLWHGTNSEVMNKILQQGFNRSFCGKNATAYGKGVYFARDASFSAHRQYAVPDKKGVQYMMACRVVVGEYCQGKMDALTPDLRDPIKNTLYDSTVGLIRNDTMSNPSIIVTYHDSQAYPEYLISFKTKLQAAA